MLKYKPNVNEKREAQPIYGWSAERRTGMSLQNTHFGPVKIGEMLEGCRTLFFIGIGGINMSSLAELALARGFAVSGSDRTRTALTDELTRAGL